MFSHCYFKIAIFSNQAQNLKWRHCKYQLLKIANFNIQIQNLFVLKSLKYESCQLFFGKAIFSLYIIESCMLTDWLNEECLEHARTFWLNTPTLSSCACIQHTHSLSLSLSLFHSLPLSLSFSLSPSFSVRWTGSAHPLNRSERERQRESER